MTSRRAEFERHIQGLVATRRLYTVLIAAFLAFLLSASLWFANESNAGKFWDRLPHAADFISWVWPAHWPDVWRALFDLPSPFADGTFATDFPDGRVYLFGSSFYVPEYFYKMLETINIAVLSTVIGFTFGFIGCFLAARNINGNGPSRFLVRRVLEIMRAFPEIVIAVLFASILSLGPVPAIMAVGIHTIGALGKLFFEVVENADTKASEGLQSAGAGRLQRIRFGIVPQVLPNFLSYGLLRLEANVRASTIIGAVGGGGIGEELRLSISRGYGAKAVAIMFLLFVTIVLIDRLSAILRRRNWSWFRPDCP